MDKRTTILDGDDIGSQVEGRIGELGDHGTSDQAEGGKDLVRDEDDTNGNV